MARCADSVPVPTATRPLALAGVLLLAATSLGLGCASGTDSCGISLSTSSECEADPCAVDCQTHEVGVQCCISRHGRGLAGRAAGTLSESCEGRACDADRHISEEAATCVAQVYGLPTGIGWCGAAFAGQGSEYVWIAINTESETDCDSGSRYFFRSGQAMRLDSQSGALLDDSIEFGSTLECR